MKPLNIPAHIAIIPDGNRRWAKDKGLPSFKGHKYAAEKVMPDLIEKSNQLGIKYLTFWALSTENFTNRTRDEISRLINLLNYFLKNKIKEFKKKGIRIKTIGDLEKLPQNTQDLLKRGKEETKNNNKITVIFGLNYGGRDEILRAVNKIFNSQFLIANLNMNNFNQFLDTKDFPDPDLIIRTGGEKRLSGFFPWQSVYSELYFSDLKFPDFGSGELEKAVEEYSFRQRRFGK